MSVAVCFAKFLSLDVVDENPADVSARNMDLWPTAGDVPDYAYKSLGTLFGVNATGDLEKFMTYRDGEGYTHQPGEVNMIVIPSESVNVPSPIRENIPGAESAYIDFMIKSPAGKRSVQRMENIELRIRYLIDTEWRKVRKARPNYIPATGDSSIHGYIWCKFDSYMTNLTAEEIQFRYAIAYNRAVPK